MTPYLIITDPKAKLRIAVATSRDMAITQIVEQKDGTAALYLPGITLVAAEKFDVLIEQTLHANESILPQTEPPAADAPAATADRLPSFSLVKIQNLLRAEIRTPHTNAYREGLEFAEELVKKELVAEHNAFENFDDDYDDEEELEAVVN